MLRTIVVRRAVTYAKSTKYFAAYRLHRVCIANAIYNDNQPARRPTGDATPLRITIETKRWDERVCAKAIVLRITRPNALQMEKGFSLYCRRRDS